MHATFAILDLNAEDIAVILGIIGLVLGRNKIPGLPKNLGQSLKGFREGLDEANALKKDFKQQIAETKQAVHGVAGHPAEDEQKS